MILSTVIKLSLVWAVSAESGWFNDRIEDMPKDVQTHFQTVLSDRYNRLYWDMYQNCNSSFNPQVVLNLQIISLTDEPEKLDKLVQWDIREPPCSIYVYSTMDEVLINWCKEQPGRILTFPYIQTKAEFWTNDPNFKVVVQAKCHRFRHEVDIPRVPLPAPFDIRQDDLKYFVIYFVPSALLILVLIFLYMHRIPFYNCTTTRWSNYWDQREWEKIRDVIEYREQLINEENEKKMLEKYLNEKKLVEQTSIDME